MCIRDRLCAAENDTVDSCFLQDLLNGSGQDVYKRQYLFKDDVFAGADEGAVAAYLAKAVKKCEAENGQPYGMIFCGKESTDEISGQVGARLAEILGTGFVSSVIEAEPQGDGLVAKQETEEGYICLLYTSMRRFSDCPLTRLCWTRWPWRDICCRT